MSGLYKGLRLLEEITKIIADFFFLFHMDFYMYLSNLEMIFFRHLYIRAWFIRFDSDLFCDCTSIKVKME